MVHCNYTSEQVRRLNKAPKNTRDKIYFSPQIFFFKSLLKTPPVRMDVQQCKARVVVNIVKLWMSQFTFKNFSLIYITFLP